MISELVHAGLPMAGHAHLSVLPLAKSTSVNTGGILSFLTTKIAPILLAILGILFIGRAGKGEVSRVLTSSVIAIVGLVFIGGAVALVFLGNTLISVLFTTTS